MIYSGDSIRVVHPLFREEDDGSIPISPLQFNIGRIPPKVFKLLNEEWHSRLPNINSNFTGGLFYGAEYKNRYYAVAWWTDPISRGLNNRNWLELRRFAIASDAPKNTASRMLKVMRKRIRIVMPNIINLISYQDESVHTGTIYKASGWKPVAHSKKRIPTQSWEGRVGRKIQTSEAKTRWEYKL